MSRQLNPLISKYLDKYGLEKIEQLPLFTDMNFAKDCEIFEDMKLDSKSILWNLDRWKALCGPDPSRNFAGIKESSAKILDLLVIFCFSATGSSYVMHDNTLVGCFSYKGKAMSARHIARIHENKTSTTIEVSVVQNVLDELEDLQIIHRLENGMYVETTGSFAYTKSPFDIQDTVAEEEATELHMQIIRNVAVQRKTVAA